MMLRVYTESRDIYIECSELPTVIKHHIPKKNKYFKEELRRFRKEIQDWLMGRTVDEIYFVFQSDMTFYHRVLYQNIVRATFRTDGLVLLHIITEEEEVD